jgi:hypothetical protein
VVGEALDLVAGGAELAVAPVVVVAALLAEVPGAALGLGNRVEDAVQPPRLASSRANGAIISRSSIAPRPMPAAISWRYVTSPFCREAIRAMTTSRG